MKPSQKVVDRIELISAVAHLMMVDSGLTVDPPKTPPAKTGKRANRPMRKR